MKFVWTATCQDAFDKIKAVLRSEPILMAPNFNKQFKLYMDASDTGTAAGRDANEQDHPFATFPRNLTVTNVITPFRILKFMLAQQWLQY